MISSYPGSSLQTKYITDSVRRTVLSTTQEQHYRVIITEYGVRSSLDLLL